jgi:hypothetical protein
MKNVMIVALLSVGVCVAGDHVVHNAVGAPLQVPVIVAMAVAAAHGNNDQVHVPKPKHSAKPNKKKECFNRPTKEKNHCRGGYRVKR